MSQRMKFTFLQAPKPTRRHLYIRFSVFSNDKAASMGKLDFTPKAWRAFKRRMRNVPGVIIHEQKGFS